MSVDRRNFSLIFLGFVRRVERQIEFVLLVRFRLKSKEKKAKKFSFRVFAAKNSFTIQIPSPARWKARWTWKVDGNICFFCFLAERRRKSLRFLRFDSFRNDSLRHNKSSQRNPIEFLSLISTNDEKAPLCKSTKFLLEKENVLFSRDEKSFPFFLLFQRTRAR